MIDLLRSLFLAILISVAATATADAGSFVRVSDDAEIAFRQGDSSGFPTDGWNSLYFDVTNNARWIEHGALWQRNHIDLEPTDMIFSPGDEITILTNIIDYDRASFTLNFSSTDNLLTLTSNETRPGVISRELRFPEDLRKTLLFPIGKLAPGEYELRIVSDRIVEDYQLGDFYLEGSHAVVDESIRFVVVPEPDAITGFAIGFVCIFGRFRRTLQIR